MHLKDMKDCAIITVIAMCKYLPNLIKYKIKYNYGEKSSKTPFVIYADLECLLIKQQSCQNNPNERKAMHEPSGYVLDLICSFDLKLNKHNFYRGKDCSKKFCSDLKQFGTKIVNYEQKEMTDLAIDYVFLYESHILYMLCTI